MIILFIIDHLVDNIQDIMYRNKYNLLIRNKTLDDFCKIQKENLKIFRLYWIKEMPSKKHEIYYPINIDLISKEIKYKNLFVGYFRNLYNYYDSEILLYLYDEIHKRISLNGIRYIVSKRSYIRNVESYEVLDYSQHEYKNYSVKHIVIEHYKEIRKKIKKTIYDSKILLVPESIAVRYNPLDITINNKSFLSQHYTGLKKYHSEKKVADSKFFIHNLHDKAKNIIFSFQSNLIMLRYIPKKHINKLEDRIVKIYYFDAFYEAKIAIFDYGDKVENNYKKEEERIFVIIELFVDSFYKKYRNVTLTTVKRRTHPLYLYARYDQNINIYIFAYIGHLLENFIYFLLRDSIIFTEDPEKSQYGFSCFYIVIKQEYINKYNWWVSIPNHENNEYREKSLRFYFYFFISRLIESNYKNYLFKNGNYIDYNKFVNLYKIIQKDIFSDTVSEEGNISIGDLFNYIDYNNKDSFYRTMIYERTLNTACIILETTIDEINVKNVIILGEYENIVDIYKKIVKHNKKIKDEIKYKQYVRKFFQPEEKKSWHKIEVNLFFL